MNNVNNNVLKIVAQAFYGNRTETEVKRENVDAFVLGNIDGIIDKYEKVDRTIVNVPNADNIVIVYNKYQEEERLQRKEELLNNEGYELKPVAVIPENNIEIYSRCIVCRIDSNGELDSLQNGDYEKFVKYLAE